MTVKSGATTIDTYRYDGANPRVQKIASTTRDYCYSNQWQILERTGEHPRPGVSRATIRLGPALQDDLILRDRVTSHRADPVTANQRMSVSTFCTITFSLRR